MARPLLALRARRAVGAALLVVPLGSALAHAQPPSPATAGAAATPPAAADDPGIAEARRRYQQGVEFYRRQRYAEAVAEFTEAFSRWPNPTILYSLAQAYEGLSDVNRAITTYRQYLELAPEGDARRADVEAKIVELERLLATVNVESNVPGAVYVDGERLGDAPGALRIPTGRHEVELRADGYVTDMQTVIVAGGTERTVTFTLEPVPTATTTQFVQVDREPIRFPRPVFYTAVGVTGASVATWGGLSIVAMRRADAYNDDPDRTNLERREAREIARTSNVMLGVAGGLAVTTVLVGVFTDWSDDEDDTEGDDAAEVALAVTPTDGGALATVRWTR